MKNDTDNPWKEALEKFFKEFIELLFPEFFLHIDWEKGWEFLDKEFNRISKDNLSAKKYVDKLVKAYLKNGSEKWFLIHIEVQGYKDPAFSERMFVYYYRIFDKFKKDIVSLAVLTDDNKKYKPSEYRREFLGCGLKFWYPAVKLIDFDFEELQNSKNPFSFVVMAQLKSILENDPLKKKDWKTELARLMFKKGYDKQKIVDIFYFIDWLVKLPEELEELYYKEIQTIEKEENMPYITTPERIGFKRGMDIGMEKGMDIGMEKGMDIGMEKALKSMIKVRFGNVSFDIERKINEASKEQLEKWIINFVNSRTIDEIFEEN